MLVVGCDEFASAADNPTRGHGPTGWSREVGRGIHRGSEKTDGMEELDIEEKKCETLVEKLKSVQEELEGILSEFVKNMTEGVTLGKK